MRFKVIAIVIMLSVLLSLVTGCNKSVKVDNDKLQATTQMSYTPKEEISGDEDKDGFINVAENDELRLMVEPTTARFYVENLKNGYRWYSIPQNAENDEVAYGVYKMELLSSMVLSYVITNTKEVSRINTYTGSVLDGNFKISKIDKGFRVDYKFSDFKLNVPMVVFLSEYGFSVKVLLNEIVCEKENFILTDIALLPYFGAAQSGTEGYIFVPDGSGGIINFDNGKESCQPYNRQVYGISRDELEGQFNLNTESKAIKMPVFGIKQGENSFLAIVEEGAAETNIMAFTNGQQSEYATCYSSFNLKTSMYYNMGVSYGGVVESTIYEEAEYQNDCIGVVYSLLSGETSDYSGMARQYNKYLLDKDLLPDKKETGMALYVDLYGGVVKKVSRFGIQSNQIVPLTTTDEVLEIVGELEKSGIANTVISYHCWNKDQLAGKLAYSAKPSGTIEGATSLKELLNNKEFKIYPIINNSLTFNKGQTILSKAVGSASNLSGVPYKVYDYSVSIGKEVGKTNYLVSAEKIISSTERISYAFTRRNYNRIGFLDLGKYLYSDYSDTSIKRGKIADRIIEALSNVDNKFDNIIINNPNIYAVKFASEISELPSGSSGQDLIDMDVPFYQIAIGKNVRYAVPSMNLEQVKYPILKMIETSSMPNYSWIYEDTSLVYNSEMSFLVNGNYKVWLQTAAEQYKELEQVYSLAEYSGIYSHNLVSEDVFLIIFNNGLKVYLNYSQEDYLCNNVCVKPGSYYVSEERGVIDEK